jgi:uncharacterized protein YndB with AHSA1/START domain
MKWLALVLGVLAGIAAILTVVGALRPADHTASVTVRLARPRAEVWTVVTDFTAYPQWFREVAASERIADIGGQPAWKERFGGFEATLVERERVEGERIVREILPAGSFSGTWTYELADEGAGTRLTVTERGHVGNPFFRGMMAFSDETRTMRLFTEALGAKLGVPAVPVTPQAP